MNSELTAILINAEEQLKQLVTVESTEYKRAEAKVIKLQKQLLSASVLEKHQLANTIKEELKLAEIQFFTLSSGNRELEIGYLHQYIKENYE